MSWQLPSLWCRALCSRSSSGRLDRALFPHRSGWVARWCRWASAGVRPGRGTWAVGTLGPCSWAHTPLEAEIGLGDPRSRCRDSRRWSPPSQPQRVPGSQAGGGCAQAAWELGAAVHMAACHGQCAQQEVLCVRVCVRGCAGCEPCMRVKWGPQRAGLLQDLQTCPQHGEGLVRV